MARFGWYSEKQRAVGGYAYYRMKSGQAETITCTSSSSTDHGTKWDDIRHVGEIIDVIETFWTGMGKTDDDDDDVVTSATRDTLPNITLDPPEPPKQCTFCYSGMPPCTCGKRITPTRTRYSFDTGLKPEGLRQNGKL